MSLMNLNKAAETETQPVFIVRDMPFYPHYVTPHKWVGAGHWKDREEYNTTQMNDMRARLTTMQLWARSWTNEVKGWKAL